MSITDAATPTGEITTETTFTSTILVQVAITVAALILFSLLKAILPLIYSPRALPAEQKSPIWFIDVFKQPIARFARCGNVAAMFVIYQNMLMTLFGILSLFGACLLMPLYYFGTDQSFNTEYRTFWSKVSLAHVETGSYTILVPVLVTGAFAFFLVQFYNQFHVVYIYFRQKTLRRAAPHNYTVMLESIPEELLTMERLSAALAKAFAPGMVRKIIPLPSQSAALLKQYNALKKSLLAEQKIERAILELRCKTDAAEAVLAARDLEADISSRAIEAISRSHGSASAVQSRAGYIDYDINKAIRKAEKQIRKANAKIQKLHKSLLEAGSKSRELKLQILRSAYLDHYDLSYMNCVPSLPPTLPGVVTSFTRLTTMSALPPPPPERKSAEECLVNESRPARLVSLGESASQPALPAQEGTPIAAGSLAAIGSMEAQSLALTQLRGLPSVSSLSQAGETGAESQGDSQGALAVSGGRTAVGEQPQGSPGADFVYDETTRRYRKIKRTLARDLFSPDATDVPASSAAISEHPGPSQSRPLLLAQRPRNGEGRGTPPPVSPALFTRFSPTEAAAASFRQARIRFTEDLSKQAALELARRRDTKGLPRSELELLEALGVAGSGPVLGTGTSSDAVLQARRRAAVRERASARIHANNYSGMLYSDQGTSSRAGEQAASSVALATGREAAGRFSEGQDGPQAAFEHPIGHTAFLIFNSQSDASMAGNSLLFMNDRAPRVHLAPDPSRVQWTKVNASAESSMIWRIVFWLLVVVLFLVYFAPQTLLINWINSVSNSWFSAIYKQVCVVSFTKSFGTSCTESVNISGESSDTVGGFGCYLCYMVSSMLITFIPNLIGIVFMSLLPKVISFLASLPPYASQAERLSSEYKVLFFFLIMIQGFIQILLSSTFNAQGLIDFKQLSEMSAIDFIQSIGRNFPSQTFTFLNYLITKYFLFTVLSLIRAGDLIFTILKLMLMRDKRGRRRIYKYGPFPYTYQLAYASHMMIIGIMYSIVAPMSTVLVFIIYTCFCIVNRYNILYVHPPLPPSEMSAEEDIMKFVAGNTYLGFIVMMIATAAFLFVQGSTLPLIGGAVIVVIMVICIFAKIIIDMRYKRAMSCLHLSDWVPPDLCRVNPKRTRRYGALQVGARRSVADNSVDSTVGIPRGQWRGMFAQPRRAVESEQAAAYVASQRMASILKGGAGKFCVGDLRAGLTQYADDKLAEAPPPEIAEGSVRGGAANGTGVSTGREPTSEPQRPRRRARQFRGRELGVSSLFPRSQKELCNMAGLQTLYTRKFFTDFEDPPVSYMRKVSTLYDDYQCELANSESLENHVLTDEEVSNLATFYTHPALSLAYIYGPNRPTQEIL